MNTHEFLDDDLRERAALYVVGSLSEADARVFRLHLPACRPCLSEVEALQQVSASLIHLSPSATPPAHLWGRVLERIRPAPASCAEKSAASSPARAASKDGAEKAHEADDAAACQVWKHWAEADGSERGPEFTFVASGAGEWQPTGVDGVEARRLFVDGRNDRVTMLVRMAAGSSYPRHIHAGPEDCFVLSGDLRAGDQHLRAGDYQRAEKGSLHGVQSSDEGCLLLIVSSLDDEIVS